MIWYSSCHRSLKLRSLAQLCVSEIRSIRVYRTPRISRETTGKRIRRIPEFQLDSCERDASSSRAHKSLVMEASPRVDEDLSPVFREARACTFLQLRHSYRLRTGARVWATFVRSYVDWRVRCPVLDVGAIVERDIERQVNYWLCCIASISRRSRIHAILADNTKKKKKRKKRKRNDCCNIYVNHYIRLCVVTTTLINIDYRKNWFISHSLWRQFSNWF